MIETNSSGYLLDIMKDIIPKEIPENIEKTAKGIRFKQPLQ